MPDPIFLAEAFVNGILLAGVLAILALGLNLIFGVVDIVWVAYLDLVMIGMYTVYWLVTALAWPLGLAGLAAALEVALLGVLVHLLIIDICGERTCDQDGCYLASRCREDGANGGMPSRPTCRPSCTGH